MERSLARLHKASAATVLNIVEFINRVYWWFCSRLLKSEYDLEATANYSNTLFKITVICVAGNMLLFDYYSCIFLDDARI